MFLKTVFLQEYQTRWTTLLKSYLNSTILKKLYLVKLFPIFDCSLPSQFDENKKSFKWVIFVPKIPSNLELYTLKSESPNCSTLEPPANQHSQFRPIADRLAELVS